MNNKISLIINSCDGFSDIWDASMFLLNKNWADRNMRTILVTDKHTNRFFDNVEVFCAGDNLDVLNRLQNVLSIIDTEYIFFTLDDYLLVNKIDNDVISRLISMMEKYNIDYLGFHNSHAIGNLLDKREKIYFLNMKSKDNYIINLYPGIWRKKFMETTIDTSLNIWEYEVSLTKKAISYGAVCCTAKNNQFPIMDTIRKGRFLHKPYKYLINHNLYKGNRKVISYFTEVKLFMMGKLKRILPNKMYKFCKLIMRKLGYSFISE